MLDKSALNVIWLYLKNIFISFLCKIRPEKNDCELLDPSTTRRCLVGKILVFRDIFFILHIFEGLFLFRFVLRLLISWCQKSNVSRRRTRVQGDQAEGHLRWKSQRKFWLNSQDFLSCQVTVMGFFLGFIFLNPYSLA
jgi:hypothetical protein